MQKPKLNSQVKVVNCILANNEYTNMHGTAKR